MTHFKTNVLVVLVLVAALCIGVGARTGRDGPATDAAKVEVVKLSPDAQKTVVELKAAFESAGQAKLVAEQGKLAAESRIAELRARLASEFNRFCAKNKFDPDDYEWNEDLTGVRRKTDTQTVKPPPAPVERK